MTEVVNHVVLTENGYRGVTPPPRAGLQNGLSGDTEDALRAEVALLRQELSKCRDTIKSLQEREKSLRDRCAISLKQTRCEFFLRGKLSCSQCQELHSSVFYLFFFWFDGEIIGVVTAKQNETKRTIISCLEKFGGFIIQQNLPIPTPICRFCSLTSGSPNRRNVS